MHIVRRLDYFHSQKLQAKERNPNCYRVVCKHNFLLGTNNDSSGRANTFRTLLFQNAYLAKSVTIKDCCLKSSGFFVRFRVEISQNFSQMETCLFGEIFSL
jgi:hypothetical protein